MASRPVCGANVATVVPLTTRVTVSVVPFEMPRPGGGVGDVDGGGADEVEAPQPASTTTLSTSARCRRVIRLRAA